LVVEGEVSALNIKGSNLHGSTTRIELKFLQGHLQGGAKQKLFFSQILTTLESQKKRLRIKNFLFARFKHGCLRRGL